MKLINKYIKRNQSFIMLSLFVLSHLTIYIAVILQKSFILGLFGFGCQALFSFILHFIMRQRCNTSFRCLMAINFA